LEERAATGNDKEEDGSIVVGLWEALRKMVNALFAISKQLQQRKKFLALPLSLSGVDSTQLKSTIAETILLRSFHSPVCGREALVESMAFELRAGTSHRGRK
jgi:hypothetical protein